VLAINRENQQQFAQRPSEMVILCRKIYLSLYSEITSRSGLIM